MGNFRVASRYAKSLIRLSEEKNIFNSVAESTDLVFSTLKNSKELRAVLKNPVVKQEIKKEILKEIFSGKISSEVDTFFNLIIDHNREDILFEIISRFIELKNEKLGIVDAVVKSAVDLEAESKTRIQKELEDFTKKKVNITYKVDSSLIGGFIVLINDQVIDSSIKNQLKLLKKKLMSETILNN
ncbi:MAG: ATP synthase F1 subunit delta [Ignavibacteriaceae bacterium]|jgi:F-type H+-transporting ATPase subunit delta|nr:ATP synthase F1 subunit delta [Ignavibacteriaceae bacterium]